jgi:glutathione peroxidase
MFDMNRIRFAALLALGTLAAGAGFAANAFAKERVVSHTGIHQFTVKTIDGKARSLADYRGKTLLVVNTASKCGNTPQYKGLEALYDKYRARGFEVLAFPANNFMGQEPGTDAQIAEFCQLNYHVSFPLFSKISVNGKDIAPLYAWLTKDSGFPGDIGWNFAKFLVGPDGKVVARFDPRTQPEDPKLVAALEAALPAAK